jgi:hypothetical protein
MFIQSTLLAETRMAEVSLLYREEVAASTSANNLWLWLIPVAVVLIGVIAYFFASRQPEILHTPMGMLHEISRAHRINFAGRTLLERIAEEAGLAQPAAMLLGPAQFDAAVEKASRTIKYDRRQQSTLGMLRRRLFAE